MDNIRQVKYNKINCTGCGDFTEADLVAFDLGKVFADAVRETAVDPVWEPLAQLDLRFYYTMRDICQELEYRRHPNLPTELTLEVRDVTRQMEFLMDDYPFAQMSRESRNSMQYNKLFEQVRSSFDSISEKAEALEALIRALTTYSGETVILKVPIFISLGSDEDGNEMIHGLDYFINGEKRSIRERVCPSCGMPMDSQAGYRNEFIIGLAGLPRVGKSAYLASLVHQLKKLPQDGFIHVKQNDSESLEKFEKDIVAPYERGETIQKTAVEHEDAIPLVYLPLQIGSREYNFIFVDMPGEVYGSMDSSGLDFISNRRSILKNADVIWCCIEPTMVDPKYTNKNVPAKTQDASRQLSSLINILNMIYITKIPSGIILTQSDLVDSEYRLFRPEVSVMDEYVLEDHSLDLLRMNDFVEDTRRFIDKMSNFRLSIEGTFEGFSMFGVASYGFDVSDKVLLSNKTIQPSMVELPFLWTLAKLGLLKVTKATQTKTLLGKEKWKLEEVEDENALYMQED